MDEIAKILVGTSPVLAVVLLLGMQLLTVIKDVAATWHQDMVDAAEARSAIKAAIDDLTRRVKLLEQEATGNVSPTLPRPPELRPNSANITAP